MSYVAIDSERFGDGQDDTLPSSTGLHNQMWDNTKALAEEPRVLCWSPICAQADITSGGTSQAGTKPYAMLNGWLSFLRTKVQVPKGTLRVIVWIAHHTLTPTVVTDSEGSLTLTFDAATKTVQRSSGTWTLDGLGTTGVVTVSFSGTASNNTAFTYVSGVSTDTLTFEEAPTDEVSVSDVTASVLRVVGELDVRLKLEGLGSAPPTTLTQTRLGAAGTPTLAVDKIEMEVNDPLAFGETWLDLAIKSRLGDQQEGVLGQSSQSSMANAVIQDGDTGPVFFQNSAAGNPDADSLEVMAVGVSPATSATQWFDLLGISDKSGKGGTHGSEAWVCGPPWLPFWPSTDEQSTLQEITYMSPRAVAIQFVCDQESVGRIDRSELRPNIIMTGSPSGRQVNGVRTLLTRPRLIATGPEGTLLSSDSAFSALGYRRQWPRMIGSSSETALWSQSIRLTTPNPRLLLRQWVACISRNSTGNANEQRDKVTGKRKLTDLPGRAAWNFRVVVDQLDDDDSGGASWSTDVTEYGEDTLARVLTITPAARGFDGSPLLAQTLEHIYQESGTDDLAYKEGAVSLEYGDDEAIQPLSFSIDLSGLDEDLIGRPLRITLYAEHDTTHELNDYLKLDPITAGVGPEGWLQLVAGQFSLFEVPKASAVLAGVRPELFLPGAYVRKTDAAKLNERLEYHWRRAGTVMPGRIYDPPFETTDTDWTTTNEASGPDLDTWAGLCVLQRNEDDEYELRVQAYIQDLDVRLTIVRYDGRMDSGAFSTELVLSSSSGASELVEDTITLTAAQVHQDGNTSNPKAAFYCYIAAKHNGAGTGYMWLTPDSREWPGDDVQTTPGNTITDVNSGTPVRYFGVDSDDDYVDDISFIEGRNISGGILFGPSRGISTDPHLKLIPNDLGAETWQFDGANTSASGGYLSGVEVDESGDYCWAVVKGDGTVGVNNNCVLAKIDMSDGTTVEQHALDHGGDDTTGFPHTVTIDRVNSQVYCAIGAGGDEVKRVDMATGAVATSGNDSSLGSELCAMAVSPNGDYLVGMGLGGDCYMAQWSLPLTGTATTWDGFNTDRTRCDGTDTTNDFGYFARLDTGSKIQPARDGSNTLWFAGGYFGTTTNQQYGGQWDPDEATYGNRVITELDVLADSNLTPGSFNKVLSVCVDKYGYVYFLCANGPQQTDEYDVVRYTPDGTKDLSFAAQPGVTMPGGGGWALGIPHAIGINEDDQVFIGTSLGYAMSWTQT